MTNENFILQPLPPPQELETIAILKQLAQSHRYLAELKGTSKTIPNESILINTLTFQKAKDSSEIENIISITVNRNCTLFALLIANTSLIIALLVLYLVLRLSV